MTWLCRPWSMLHRAWNVETCCNLTFCLWSCLGLHCKTEMNDQPHLHSETDRKWKKCADKYSAPICSIHFCFLGCTWMVFRAVLPPFLCLFISCLFVARVYLNIFLKNILFFKPDVYERWCRLTFGGGITEGFIFCLVLNYFPCISFFPVFL